MIYFTADLHLGHENIIAHCNRPCESTAEMDEVLLTNSCDRVHETDTVYILGDFMFYCKDPEHYLRCLSGRKYLIVGNNDSVWMKKVDVKQYFVSVQYMLELSDESHRLTLCHYPLMTWNRAAHGSYILYGHIHNNKDAPYWPLLAAMDHAMNAGVDVNDFRPVTFEELVENHSRFYNIV